jgi:hypothetical protein
LPISTQQNTSPEYISFSSDPTLSAFNVHILGIAWKPNQNKALDANMASVCIPHEYIYYQTVVCKLQ